jgi:hypothetical protein
MFEDEVGRIAREEVEDEPVEGEVFGLSDDDDELMQDGEGSLTNENDQEHDEAPQAGPSSLHIHFHNNPPSATSNRSKRNLRFDESHSRPTSSATIDHAHLEEKYDTPFKRSSARTVRGAKEAFEGVEQGEEGGDGPAGMLFGQETGMRARELEMEL